MSGNLRPYGEVADEFLDGIAPLVGWVAVPGGLRARLASTLEAREASLRQALETSRAETREARERFEGAQRHCSNVEAGYRSARLRAETAEGLLREETDACVCETIDPREVGITVTSQTQVACGECWWCRVRAFLAGRERAGRR